jgi:arylsulfatase A-like enzyme
MNPLPPRRSLFFCLVLILLAFPALTSLGASRPPNIIFILADDLGIFDLRCYGRTDHRTPHLDQLAAEGTRFTSATCAQPICSPSRAAILSGQAPARLHLTTYLPGRADAPSQRVLHPKIQQQLALDRLTVGEALKDAGYATACIGKWHLGGAGFGPNAQGFDTVHAGRANTPPTTEEGSKGEFDLTQRAEAFLEANRDRPFFLYLAHNSPHSPYSARPDHAAAHSKAFDPTYAAVIESLDASVGKLLARLKDLGLRDNTLVIFTSDNGGLHVPELQHARVTHNGPYRAGKGFLYEGGLRVPLIVRWPGNVPAGRVIHTPVINTDWMPTLLDLAQVPRAAQPPTDGISLAQLLTDNGSPTKRALFWHFPHYTNQGGRPGGAVRDGRWKFIEFYDTGVTELYDLEADPGETRSVTKQHPRRARRMSESLAAWRLATQAQSNTPNPNLDEAQFRALYQDFDPSRFSPQKATTADWTRVAQWREAMDAAVARPRSP